MIRLEWTLGWDAQVGGLIVRQFSELDTQLVQMQTSNFLVKSLGQNVKANLEIF